MKKTEIPNTFLNVPQLTVLIIIRKSVIHFISYFTRSKVYKNLNETFTAKNTSFRLELKNYDTPKKPHFVQNTVQGNIFRL